MEFSRQDWCGCPFPSPGDLPDSGIKLASPALVGGFFTTVSPGGWGVDSPYYKEIKCILIIKNERFVILNTSRGSYPGKTVCSGRVWYWAVWINPLCKQAVGGEGVCGASLVAQMVKNPPVIWETWIWFLGWKAPLEKGMATHSSILAWRIPMDRGAWWATEHGVTKSWTWLSTEHTAGRETICLNHLLEELARNSCRKTMLILFS